MGHFLALVTSCFLWAKVLMTSFRLFSHKQAKWIWPCLLLPHALQQPSTRRGFAVLRRMRFSFTGRRWCAVHLKHTTFPQPSILHPLYHHQGQMTLEQCPVLILSVLKIILKNNLCNCLTPVLQSRQSSVAAGLSSSGQHRAWYKGVLTTCKGNWMNEWVIRDCLRP